MTSSGQPGPQAPDVRLDVSGLEVREIGRAHV